MSRWIQQFEEHAFRNYWNQIVEIKDDINVDDQSIATSVQEIARLVKVLTYIDSLLESCDPELMPANVWDNFHSQCNSCLQNINSYQSNRNIGHITNANSHADNLLNYIRPYVVPAGKAAKSASASFTHYSKTIAKHLDSFNTKSSSVLFDLNEIHVQASSSKSEIDEFRQDIENFNTKILIGEGEPSYSDRFDQLLNAIEEMHDKIVAYHTELNIGTEDKASIVKLISDTRSSILARDMEMEKN